jgi:hypothetical protein
MLSSKPSFVFVSIYFDITSLKIKCKPLKKMFSKEEGGHPAKEMEERAEIPEHEVQLLPLLVRTQCQPAVGKIGR